uniref:FAD/NAD(P)-binding protein n=1 Tax=Streptomyces sp. NBC_00003 TaxID=2903608 RepID=A0AAU2VDG1_9ACTN
MSGGFSIAVVGGGAAAVCLLDALAHTDHPGGTLTVFEPSPHLWRGRPYQVDADTLTINMVPADMSVRAGDPGHFAYWLAGRDKATGRPTPADPHSGATFAPRTVYGEYLEQTAYAAMGILRRKGWRVDLIGAPITSASRYAQRVMLQTKDGRARVFDYAVLAVGRGAPEDVYGLDGADGYIPDPYPAVERLHTIGTDEHVAVLGSGLTAVDTVRYLAAMGHRGGITLVSRHGVLPAVRQEPADFQVRHATQPRIRALAAQGGEFTLADLLDIFRKELADAGSDPQTVTREIASTFTEDPVSRLRRQLGLVDSKDLGLRILQRAIPDVGPDLWPLLRDTDRTRLLHTHTRTLMSLCCPMPPGSAALLLDLAEQGQLDIRCGLRHVEAEGKNSFTLTTRTGAFHADRIVNTISASRLRIPHGAQRLVTSLLRSRNAVPNPYGGLMIERATSRLTVASQPDPRLYALGDLAAGALLFTWGIPSLVDRARDITEAIGAHHQAVLQTPELLSA